MKKLLILALLFSAPALANNAGICYTIADQDARTLCRAKAHKDPAICYGIQKQDLRAICRAEVTR